MESLDLAKVRVSGSAEEVREIGVDPRRVHTCGPPRPGMVQCPLYDQCDRPEKDEIGHVRWMKDGQEVIPKGPSFANLEGAVREGPGPLNLGIRRTKIVGEGTFRMVNAVCACWQLPYQRQRHLASNEGGKKPVALFQVIAIEGQKIALPGSLPVVQDDLKIIHVRQPGGIECILAPIPRPRDNLAFKASVDATAEIRREEELAKRSNLRDFVNLKPGVVPDGTETPADLDLGPAKGGASSRG